MIDQIETAIASYEQAHRALVDAVAAELVADSDQSELKDQLIASLVGNHNQLTGKPHSASSAADYATSLPEYRAAVTRHRNAVVTKIAAQGAAQAARLRAEALIACAKLGVAA